MRTGFEPEPGFKNERFDFSYSKDTASFFSKYLSQGALFVVRNDQAVVFITDNFFIQQMHGIIQYMFDYWADPVVYSLKELPSSKLRLKVPSLDSFSCETSFCNTDPRGWN